MQKNTKKKKNAPDSIRRILIKGIFALALVIFKEIVNTKTHKERRSMSDTKENVQGDWNISFMHLLKNESPIF